MKILHTSDWHLGRSLSNSVPLHDDQVEFCAWLLECAISNGVELLVVAGDLYDRAIPPPASVALWRDTLRAFHAAGIAVVAIAGNHDGPDRVAAFDGLTDDARIFVRGGYERAAELLTLEFSDGPLDIALVPFLDPLLAPPAWRDELAAVDRPRTHETVLDLALSRIRPDRTSRRSLAVVHAFVTGASTSDSERTLSVGGTDLVPASVLDGFSYVALGHLHRPQIIGGDESIRYSGTPLPYSFSEEGPKSVVLIDLAVDGSCSTTIVEIPVGRRVTTIVGPIEELLASDAHPEALDLYVKAVLTDPEFVVDAKARLADRYRHIVDVVLEPIADVDDGPRIEPEARSSLTPLDTIDRFWADVVGTTLDDTDRATFIEVLDDVFVTGEANR